MKDYIQQAVRTESKPTLEVMERLAAQTRAMHAFMGFMTELGELIDPYKRHIFYGAPLDRTNAAEECGDVFWYLAILFDELGIDFEKCMVANIAKLRARYPEKFTEAQAVQRDVAAERAVLDKVLQETNCVMHEVESSNITHIGHNDNTLIVHFKGGGRYRYNDVPKTLFDEFMESDSKGKFLNSKIKPVYDYEPIL